MPVTATQQLPLVLCDATSDALHVPPGLHALTGAETVTVTDFVPLEPALLLQDNAKVVVDDSVSDWLPLVALEPAKLPPVAVQLTGAVAVLLILHDRVVLPPLVTDVGEPENVSVGATAVEPLVGVVPPVEGFADVPLVDVVGELGVFCAAFVVEG